MSAGLSQAANAWTLVAVVAAGAALRLAGLDARSFWGDEIVSLNVASGFSWYPWSGEESALFYSASYYRERLSLAPGYFSQQLVPLLRVNDQVPPLYYVLLNLWMHIVGTSAPAVRALPMMASLASVPAIYAIGRTLDSPRVGLYAAAIFALAPFQVAFGLYNRPYALLCFFALSGTIAAVRLCRPGASTKWHALFAVAAILGIYTHYLFVWSLAAQFAIVALYRWHDRVFMRRFAVTCCVVAAVCLLWVPTFLDQARWSSSVGSQSWFYWYSGAPSLSNAVSSLGRNVLLLLTGGRIHGLCGDADDCRLDDVATLALYVIPLMTIAFAGWSVFRQIARRSDTSSGPNPWLVCVLWGGAVLAGPVIGDLLLNSHMVFSHRYFIAAGGPLYLAVALSLSRIANRTIRGALVGGLLAFLLVGSLFYLRGWSNTLTYEVPTREVAAIIDAQEGGPVDLILMLDPGLNPTDFAFYLKSNPDFARVDIPERHSGAADIPSQLAQITAAAARDRVWYLDDHGPETEAHSAVFEWLRANYREAEVHAFANVGLFLYEPRTGDTPSAASR